MAITTRARYNDASAHNPPARAYVYIGIGVWLVVNASERRKIDPLRAEIITGSDTCILLLTVSYFFFFVYFRDACIQYTLDDGFLAD